MWSRLLGERYEGEVPSTDSLMRLHNHPYEPFSLGEGTYINERYVKYHAQGCGIIYDLQKQKFIFCSRKGEDLDAYRFLINGGAWGLL